MARRESEDEVLRCSFCNKSQREVKKLIAGPTVFICDECVDICLDIIAEDRMLEASHLGEGNLLPAEQLERELDQHVVGQSVGKKALAAALHHHLARGEVLDRRLSVKKSNILLLGPPGTGKTLTVRCIVEALNIPSASIDGPRLTGLSYFRNENVLEILYQNAGNDLARAEKGLLCIDQLDRIGFRDSADDPGRRVQESLLEVLEGAKVSFTRTKSGGQTESIAIDTSGILFIGCGSFSTGGSRGTRNRRETLIQQGFLPEFVDRFSLIIEFEPLSEADLRTLLTRPKGMLEEYRALFEVDRIRLGFSDDAVQAIAREAFRRGAGARSLRAILESIALDLSSELLSKPRPLSFTVEESFASSSF